MITATGHDQITKGEWDVCAATVDAYDIKHKVGIMHRSTLYI